MDAMQFIASWMKQIILVVLLAVFLEFLLPSQTMQKYTRLVMGMFLVAVMLIPIGKILHLDFNTVENQVLQLLQQSPASESLSSIYQQASQLKQDEQSQTITQWKQQLEDATKLQIQEQFPVQIDSVSIDTSVQKDQNVPSIQSIHVNVQQVFKSGDPANQMGQGSGSTSLQPQPVQVKPVQPVEETDPAIPVGAQSSSALDTNKLSQQERSIRDQIETYLQGQFQISKDAIVITFQDASRG